MAQVIHLRCRHCGEPMKNNPWPYCSPCNLALCYKAMPLLLGILMTSHITPPSTTALVASATKKS
jgi:hypothetical protein